MMHPSLAMAGLMLKRKRTVNLIGDDQMKYEHYSYS